MTYVSEILEEIIRASSNHNNNGPSGLHLFDLFRIASEEIEKLDVLHFPPDKRFLFTIIRQKFRNLGKLGVLDGREIPRFLVLAKEAQTLLSYFGDFGSTLNSRNFSFLIDPDLRGIIERDYSELNNKLIPDEAWKSSVVLAGSILEAILFDVLENPKFYPSVLSSKAAPKNKLGQIIDPKTKEWKLIDLIKVAEEIGLLPAARANSIDQILRDFRNFVHPKKEIRSQFPCTEAEGLLAKGALDAVLNHFENVVP